MFREELLQPIQSFLKGKSRNPAMLDWNIERIRFLEVSTARREPIFNGDGVKRRSI